MKGVVLFFVALCLISSLPSSSGQLPDWPDIFDPYVVNILHLNFPGGDDDWMTIVNDTTFSSYMNATFYAEGDDVEPIVVGVRRKSCEVIGTEKVSIKIDINYYVDQTWHKLKKLSLENGPDVLSEGVAWQLNVMADSVYTSNVSQPHWTSMAAWVSLYVNGRYIGAYTSVEQHDVSFLKNRNEWYSNQTWIYKNPDFGEPVVFRSPDNRPVSPAFEALCYSPFDTTCHMCHCTTTPADTVFYQDVVSNINTQAMLTTAAIEIIYYATDGFFLKGKNFDFADYDYLPRHYINSDLDSVFSSKNINAPIYRTIQGNKQGSQTIYQERILNHPCFRPWYNDILTTLEKGPLSAANVCSMLKDLSASPVKQALDQDPYTSSNFDSFCSFVTERWNSIMPQVMANNNPPPRTGMTCPERPIY